MRLVYTRQFETTSRAILTAPYETSLLVAKTKKAHNIDETLIKSYLVTCAGILLGESMVPKLKQVSLSNASPVFRI